MRYGIFKILILCIFLMFSSAELAYAQDEQAAEETQTSSAPRITVKTDADEMFRPYEITDRMLRAYIKSSMRANHAKGRLVKTLREASEEERPELYKKARAEMSALVEEDGTISFEDFEKISKSAQAYPEVYDRVMKMFMEYN